MEHTEVDMDLSILELKTCPFCGGRANAFLEDGEVTIKCGCGASLSRFIKGYPKNIYYILDTLDEAKKLWNTEKERNIQKPIDWSKAKTV